MNSAEDADPGPLKFVVGGALALAAHFFPHTDQEGKVRVRLDDACFLLSGHVEIWAAWPGLQREDQVRIARLLRFRPVEIANRNVFARWVGALVPRHIAGFRDVGPGELLADMGRPPLEYADECVMALLAEREVAEHKPAASAGAGDYATALYVPAGSREGTRTLDVRYRLEINSPAPAGDPADVGEPAAADLIEVPVAELREIAVRLDAASGETYRAESADRIFAHMQSADGEVTSRWSLTAGPTRIFQAPTGAGKNVIAELLACWCAARGMVTTLVLPTNAAVVKTAYVIERSLRMLGLEGGVVPLTSPDSAQKVAETAARGAGADAARACGRWSAWHTGARSRLLPSRRRRPMPGSPGQSPVLACDGSGQTAAPRAAGTPARGNRRAESTATPARRHPRQLS